MANVKDNPKAAKARAPLSEKDKQAAFAVLALVAIAAAAYFVFIAEPPDSPSDGSEFYSMLVSSDSAAIVYDARSADAATAQKMYQCGVDMISKGRFAGKSLRVIACDANGCMSSQPGTASTTTLTYEQAKKSLSATPYILIKPGQPGYLFFQRHMEISIGAAAGDVTCDISATESYEN